MRDAGLVYDDGRRVVGTLMFNDVINAGQIINIERSILVSGGQACPLLLYMLMIEKLCLFASNFIFPRSTIRQMYRRQAGVPRFWLNWVASLCQAIIIFDE